MKLRIFVSIIYSFIVILIAIAITRGVNVISVNYSTAAILDGNQECYDLLDCIQKIYHISMDNHNKTISYTPVNSTSTCNDECTEHHYPKIIFIGISYTILFNVAEIAITFISTITRINNSQIVKVMCVIRIAASIISMIVFLFMYNISICNLSTYTSIILFTISLILLDLYNISNFENNFHAILMCVLSSMALIFFMYTPCDDMIHTAVINNITCIGIEECFMGLCNITMINNTAYIKLELDTMNSVNIMYLVTCIILLCIIEPICMIFDQRYENNTHEFKLNYLTCTYHPFYKSLTCGCEERILFTRCTLIKYIPIVLYIVSMFVLCILYNSNAPHIIIPSSCYNLYYASYIPAGTLFILILILRIAVMADMRYRYVYA